jgi:16S rRNA (guanine527-N7)-methyltransferase
MSKRSEVERYLKEKNVSDSQRVMRLFDTYFNWLLDENERINLISRKTDPDDIWTLHFLDSILSISCVDFKEKKILDFGTGGGFPGIPLASMYPDAHVTMLDSTKKKIQSVKCGAAAVGLTNCSFLDIRLEDADEKLFGTFDIVVSRSVRILPEFKKILFKLLKDDGSVVLYKSQNLDDAALFKKVHITDASTPLIGERKIIVINKNECV